MNRTKSNRPSRIVRCGPRGRSLLAIVLLALAAPCASAQGDLTSAQLREAARQKIANMTDAERARLQSDFEKFRNLPEAERKKLRELDRELQADPALRQTMQDYMSFLEPLTQGERLDLRNEPDVAKRVALVRAVVKEQQDRAESSSRRALGVKDLDAVLGIIEERLRAQKLTAAQSDALTDKTGLARHVAIFELIARPPGGERGTVPTLFGDSPPDLLDRITEAVSDGELRKRLGRGSRLERMRRLFWLIEAGIWAEFEASKPSEEKLGEFMASLPAAQMEQLMRFRPDHFQRMLIRMYAEAHPDQLPMPPGRRSFFSERNRGRAFGAGRGPDGERLRGPGGPPRGAEGDTAPSPNGRRSRQEKRPSSE